ncbi:MAG: FAD-dependent oxidoreductase [Myxococcota bacterium]
MSMKPAAERVQVLVVGAGPVGLFAALCAAKRGLHVLVIDHVWRGYASGHASLLHTGFLDLLEDGPLLRKLKADGHTLDRVAVHVDGTEVAACELPAPALVVPQSVLEGALLSELRALDVEVRTPHQAATIEQHAGHVDVRVLRRELVTSGSPALRSEWEPVESMLVQADFVVGADGYDSRVRSALGIDVVEVGALESFAIFEVSGHAEARSSASLLFNESVGSLLLPLPNGRFRWALQLSDSLDSTPDIELLRSLLKARPPAHAEEIDHVDWSTVMHFERRLARGFGKGRVWLAGDAAHVTNPFGAQSMNVGLQEAHTLIGRIADALQGRNGHGSLERYAAEYEREWHKLFGINVRFDLAPNAPRWLSTYARRIVPALPASGPDLEKMLGQLGLRLS